MAKVTISDKVSIDALNEIHSGSQKKVTNDCAQLKNKSPNTVMKCNHDFKKDLEEDLLLNNY